MSAVKKIVSVAALAGVLAGLLFTLIQQFQVIPLIRQAEVHEEAAEAAKQTPPATIIAQHRHGQGQASPEHTTHERTVSEPTDVKSTIHWQRNLFTAMANIILGLGFALLLGAAVTLRGADLTWRHGLAWGLAGYCVFFVAPALGLPPELPGTQAAELMHRQAWWVTAAVCTAAGLSLLAFAQAWAIKIAGAILLVVPHLIGAPQPAVQGSVAPEALIKTFITATVIANAIFWLALGGLYGFFHRKFA